VALSFDFPNIARTPPAGTCWPLVGDVILTPCDIEDADNDNDGDAPADGEDVGGIDGDDCFVVSFVPDVFDDDNGMFGDGENVVCPYALLIHKVLNHTLERRSPNTISRVINPPAGLMTTVILVNAN
jgi:hypothetical protein